MSLRSVAAAVFICLLTFGSLHSKDWIPPEDPIPKQVLKEAKADRKAERYEEALAKHLWFHENALEYDPSLSGVRTTSAIRNWFALAEVYPPALKELETIRNASHQAVMASLDKSVDRSSLQILSSIDRVLDQSDKTVEVFKTIEEKKPDQAHRAYRTVERALINNKEYAICSKYMDPEVDLLSEIHLYRMTMSHAKQKEHSQELRDFHKNKLIKSVSTIVAILVANDSKQEAIEIAEEAKSLIKENDTLEALSTALESALEGNVPEQ